jgi:UDP-glucose 4-epimerase/UDP-glucuronate 4-epimerase
LSVNLVGLATVARLAAKTDIRRLINLSSGSAYGLPDEDESDWPPTLREEHTRERPVSLYALSKFATEIATRRIAALTGLDALSVRLSSIFGPWERDTGFRDTLSAPLQASVAAQCGEPVILERHESRDWTYSRDVADALLALMSHQNPKYDLYNITAGRTWGTIDWCKQLARYFPNFSYRLAEADDTPTIDLYSTTDRPPLDPGRLRDDLGYTLPYHIDTMFADFRQWLSANPDFWVR